VEITEMAAAGAICPDDIGRFSSGIFSGESVSLQIEVPFAPASLPLQNPLQSMTASQRTKTLQR
jgi:hypothetical protein